MLFKAAYVRKQVEIEAQRRTELNRIGVGAAISGDFGSKPIAKSSLNPNIPAGKKTTDLQSPKTSTPAASGPDSFNAKLAKLQGETTTQTKEAITSSQKRNTGFERPKNYQSSIDFTTNVLPKGHQIQKVALAPEKEVNVHAID